MTEFIGACIKWVDERPEVDPLTAEVRTDPRTSGLGAADRAALEYALRLSESWSWPVVALTAGPPGSEAVLRDA
ncbi:MAG: mycofactocin-associated electron transfer flavoprotein beta subunit, partial [Acidimicrobiales bacterium]